MYGHLSSSSLNSELRGHFRLSRAFWKVDKFECDTKDKVHRPQKTLYTRLFKKYAPNIHPQDAVKFSEQPETRT
jgi:hypothetical protein